MEIEKFRYFPTARSGETEEEPVEQEVRGKYPCPCCGCITLPVPREEAIACICPVCFRENDVFATSDDEPSDENHGMSLNEARKNHQSFGFFCKEMLCHVRKPALEELRR